MRRSVVEYKQNKSNVAVVKSTKIVVEEINKTCKALISRAFYNAKTDEEFIRIMNSERYNSAPQLYIQDIRLPHNNPWITKDGFEFDYNDGEYSNYYVSEVGGSISFTISSTKMKQYLSDEGKTFVE